MPFSIFEVRVDAIRIALSIQSVLGVLVSRWLRWGSFSFSRPLFTTSDTCEHSLTLASTPRSFLHVFRWSQACLLGAVMPRCTEVIPAAGGHV
eukprot:2254216-Amphidinium_carterae.1